MARDTAGSRYDLEPLLPYIQQDYVLLTPNLRLARRIKAEWDARQRTAGLRAWSPLPVYPAESWLVQRWQQAAWQQPPLRRQLLETSQALLLWRQVIEQDQQQGDYSLLQSQAAASQAQQARNQLLRWQVDRQAAGIAARFRLDTDCATFLRWLDAFEARLADGGLATGLDVIAALQGAALAQGNRPRALLIAFDDVPPLLRTALTHACAEVAELPQPAPVADCQARAFADRNSELQAVARWARVTYDAHAGASIGIVLDDMRGDRQRLEYLLRREFDCLDANYAALPVNFSTGWQLAEVPVVRDALAALAAVNAPAPVQRVLALLRSRFLQLPDRYSPEGLAFVTRLHDHGRETIEAGALRNLAKDLRLGHILLDCAGQRALREPALPSQWAERFHQLLALWGWPGEGGLDSLEYQQVEEAYRQLDALGAFDAVCGPLGFADALGLLRQCCQDTSFQPRTEDSRIQVLGPLEAAGLEFDALWLCGMQASQWPAPARPNPFLPLSLQRECAMPHASAEREWRYAHSLLQQYRACSRTLIASYSQSIDGAPELPSALLEDFTWQQDAAEAGPPGAWLQQWQERDIEWLADHSAPAPDAEELARTGGGSGLIEDQSHCPFRAFARRRLRLQALSEPSLALNAAERGTLVHQALFVIWGELETSAALAALDAAAESQLLARAAAAAIDALPTARRLAVGSACIAQEQRYLHTLLQEWLALERQREPFAVIAREQRQDIALGPLHLHLQVDRIDRVGAEVAGAADGAVTIIDYKTGSCEASHWLGQRPTQPQLPLYSMASQQPVEALAFGHVKARSAAYKGLGARAVAPGISDDIARATRRKEPLENWPALLDQWQATLQHLADDFLAGEARVDPINSNSCTYCGLQSVCRVEAAMPEHSRENRLHNTQEDEA
ncbi:PD-(D/E)XK nuclease family protein [Parahaliea mediterranea]|uniref:PD-(D/E)XK nuclease family protein n=1 Tax=Parahaliea mediterranea TaxID=651086 RepID=UPI0013009808|nr:PD-(D/E)XK nuclease family protein [Parahaliea mediterranea]